jgi:hypothetical protein
MKTEASLLVRISQRNNVKIAVIGLGYVGLPLAMRLAKEGLYVLGVDIQPQIIQKIRSGCSTVEGIRDEEVDDVVNRSQKLMPVLIEANPNANTSESLSPLIGVDVFVICVQTPLHRDRGWDPETQFISKSAQLFVRLVKKNERAPVYPPNVSLFSRALRTQVQPEQYFLKYAISLLSWERDACSRTRQRELVRVPKPMATPPSNLRSNQRLSRFPASSVALIR